MINNKNLKFRMVQMEIFAGEPQRNFETLRNHVLLAKNDKIDVVAFPEMCIPGYLIGDRWEFVDFLEEIEDLHEKIKDLSQGICLIWGSVFRDTKQRGEDGHKRLYNAWFAAKDQEWISNSLGFKAFPKVLSPNYRLFDESRYFFDLRKLAFESNTLIELMINPIEIEGIKIGITLCEDGWDDDYNVSPLKILAQKGADLLINLSCSPFSLGKSEKRERVFSQKAKDLKVPLVYLNGISVQNTGKTFYLIDGNSTVYTKSGDSIHPLEWGNTGLFDFEIPESKTISMGDSNHKIPSENQRILQCLKLVIGFYLKEAKLKKVVIGASGGVDSAVNAALFASIIGPENLLLVNMPSKYNSDLTKSLAFDLAKNIGCWYSEISIEESVEVTRKQMGKLEIKRDKETKIIELSPFHFENVQARDRSARILSALACSFGGVFTCNANKAEMTVGYSTLYGDLGGFLAPLSDLWKHQIYELGRSLNLERPVIPEGVFTVVPSAELSDAQDVNAGKGDPLIYPYHDYLFRSFTERWESASPYLILEWFKNDVLEKELGMMTFLPEELKNPTKFIEDLERWYGLFCTLGQIKRIQAPPVIAISKRPYGFDWREAVLKPYYSQKYLNLRTELIEKESI